MSRIQRRATRTDLASIVSLLREDELGQTRECDGSELDMRYIEAFNRIDADPNQYLMVEVEADELVGTCHLTMMPSLTFTGTTRLQIEGVRVKESCRGQKIGEWMMQEAIQYGKSKGASIIQLTTNLERPRAKSFYERLGFVSSHVGMKLSRN